MSDKIVEQAEDSASKIGKFNTVDDLLAAYNALESEFTKRCQLIKQLQAELEASKAQAQDARPDVSLEPQEQMRPVPEVEAGQEQESVPVVPSATHEVSTDEVLNAVLQNACEYAEALSRVPEIMSACIASYKQRLIRPHPAPAPAGMAVIVPTEKPRTLSEAKRLADALLSGN